MEGYQGHQMPTYQEGAHLQEDSQEEASQVGAHQEAEGHQEAEDHQEEGHHPFHLPQPQYKARTSSSVTHCTYSHETGPSPKNSSRNGRCMKESTSQIT
jgi:hypothetical protein